MPANGKAEEAGTCRSSISVYHKHRRPSLTETEIRSTSKEVSPCEIHAVEKLQGEKTICISPRNLCVDNKKAGSLLQSHIHKTNINIIVI